MPGKLAWKDIEDIAIQLAEAHPRRDPTAVRFTELRALVEALPDFAPEPGHVVNESILEAIQAAWIEESEAMDGGNNHQENEDEDKPGYVPPTPFRP